MSFIAELLGHEAAEAASHEGAEVGGRIGRKGSRGASKLGKIAGARSSLIKRFANPLEDEMGGLDDLQDADEFFDAEDAGGLTSDNLELSKQVMKENLRQGLKGALEGVGITAEHAKRADQAIEGLRPSRLITHEHISTVTGAVESTGKVVKQGAKFAYNNPKTTMAGVVAIKSGVPQAAMRGAAATVGAGAVGGAGYGGTKLYDTIKKKS